MKVTVDKKLLENIAHLSRLQFSEEDEAAMRNDLNDILKWVEKLDEVDTEGVAPLIHISSEVNVLREDQVGTHLDHEKGLMNAPRRDSNYFRVPRVLD